MSNIKYFKKQVKYWAKKLGIGEVTLCSDKDMWAFFSVNWYGNQKWMYYNPKYVNYYDKAVLIHGIFHELGHFYKENGYRYYPYDKYTNKMICEYIAEKRAFYWLKKYYPGYYKKQIKRAKREIEYTLTYPKNRSYYFEAWSQLPEYANCLTSKQ